MVWLGDHQLRSGATENKWSCLPVAAFVAHAFGGQWCPVLLWLLLLSNCVVSSGLLFDMRSLLSLMLMLISRGVACRNWSMYSRCKMRRRMT